MRPAQERLEKDLRATEFSALRIPLVTNVDAAVITSGEEAREALIRQVTLPVRWEESMRELIEQGATTFVEVGPGRVLSGLLRQIERSVHSLQRGRRKVAARRRSNAWCRCRAKRPSRGVPEVRADSASCSA